MVYSLIPFPLILWAAVTDCKRRIIPDTVNVLLFFIGILSCVAYNPISYFDRLLGLMLPLIVMIYLAVRFGGIGGGDIKYTAALGFYFGINRLVFIYLIAAIVGGVWCKFKRQKSIPLATFLSVGYAFYITLIERACYL